MDTKRLSSKAVELRLSLTGLGLDNETAYGIDEGYTRIYSALKAVRDAERERCAKLVEDIAGRLRERNDTLFFDEVAGSIEDCAAAIREGEK